jgi:hypothetical protein
MTLTPKEVEALLSDLHELATLTERVDNVIFIARIIAVIVGANEAVSRRAADAIRQFVKHGPELPGKNRNADSP